MVNLNTALTAIQTDLKAFKWTSFSGEGETKFQAVFKFPNWTNLVGQPFVCLQIPNSFASPDGNKGLQWNHTLEIHVCINWSVVEGMDDDAKREEATARMVEAVQAIREYIGKETTLTKWFGNADGFVNDYEIKDANIMDLNLYRKIFILKLNDFITRY